MGERIMGVMSPSTNCYCQRHIITGEAVDVGNVRHAVGDCYIRVWPYRRVEPVDSAREVGRFESYEEARSVADTLRDTREPAERRSGMEYRVVSRAGTEGVFCVERFYNW